MLILKNNFYREITRQLEERIEYDDFFSDSLFFSIEDIDYEFIATLIIYRSTSNEIDGVDNFIVDIAPVWWELNTTINGETTINDFDFKLLKQMLCS